MKKLLTIMAACLVMVSAAQAIPTVATDHQVVNETIYDTFLGSLNPDAVWSHDNPYVGDYEAALAAGNIISVTLTINASNITPSDEQVATRFTDAHGISHVLPGFLQNGDNVFTLDKTWLDGTQVTSSIDWTWTTFIDPSDDACINWADLTVTSNPTAAVPVPGAMLLGGIGVGLVGWMRRRRSL